MKSQSLHRSAGSALALLTLVLLCLVIAGSGPVSATDSARTATIMESRSNLKQDDPLAIALDYIEANIQGLNLITSDLADIIVTDQYTSRHNGVMHIYLRQRFDGIDVFGANLNINIAADGRVLNVGNRFLPGLAKRINTTRAKITPAAAVESAGRSLGLQKNRPHVMLAVPDSRAETGLLSSGGISQRPIPVKLAYQPLEDGSIRLAWDLEIYEMDGQDWWSMRVDAVDGTVLHQFNYADHDNFVASTGSSSIVTVWPDGTESPVYEVSQVTPTDDQYRVFAMPAENPNRGTHDLVVGPADALASPIGWHDTDGQPGAEESITRGNNVFAYEAGNNAGFTPQGTAALSFDFPYNNLLEPDGYEAAAITNLFYWNNIIHDVLYHYGFDEASGNFQENNYGNGGAGGDSVVAEGQDPAVFNNANFYTLPDGQNPILQMGLWNFTEPMRDANLDNGIIIHEYGHGVARRLIGGPSNVSCLNNMEQPGEGLSDWLSLMLTMQAGDSGDDRRGIGTYVLGQLPTDSGIRGVPYSTDMSVDGRTYGDIPDAGIPHGVGSVLGAMLWEMTWGLTDDYGFDADFYRGNGGNNVALQLVIDGLKLQPCNPGFVDVRDAILLADQINNAGVNQCTIWTAFAKRGLGVSAQQKSINNTQDGVEAFDLPDQCIPTLKVRSSADPSPVYGGDPLTFSLLVRNDSANSHSGVTVNNDIPAGTSYVAGSASSNCAGAESGGEVSFSIGALDPDQQKICTFDVTVSSDIGSVELFSDDMEEGEGQWTISTAAGPVSWVLDTADPHSQSQSWFAQNGEEMSDLSLTMASPVMVTGSTILRFWHQYNTEALFDGGVLEIEVNGGPWADLGPAIVQGGYNMSLATAGINPLAGRNAFSGYSGGYIETMVDLGAQFAGSDVRLRFRFGSDSSGAGIDGWRIDDVQIIDEQFISNTACLNTDAAYSFCDTLQTPVLKNIGQTSTIDYTAESETNVAGSIEGDFKNTHTDDAQSEVLTEEQSGGKPKNRKSLLEHKWTFNVTTGSQATFLANAWASPSSDGDTFQFDYSTDGSTWYDLEPISATHDDGSLLSADMPGVSGPVTIRLIDTNRQPGHTALDTAYVDYLIIRTETYSGGAPPAAPAGLTATAESDSRIELSWEDKASDEFGYQIERATDEVTWGLITTLSANSTAYTDNSVVGGKTYYYRLRAYNNFGASDYSNIANASIPGSSSIHIGDLDGYTRYEGKRRWLVEVTITVHDDLDLPVAGATISGNWLDGVGRADSCDTGSDGRCMIPLTRIPLKITSVTFVIEDIVIQGASYESARNHDPDPDSDGTSITVAAAN